MLQLDMKNAVHKSSKTFSNALKIKKNYCFASFLSIKFSAVLEYLYSKPYKQPLSKIYK